MRKLVRFDEQSFVLYKSSMKTEEAVIRVQSAYPKIYLACHRHHQNAKTTQHALSQRDATLLAHLSIQNFVSQNQLAGHLGISKSTLSEAVSWLEKCGYIERNSSHKDGRVAQLKLTSYGLEAMSSSSVLETSRLSELIENLEPRRRKQAILGLEVLAEAALQLRKKKTETGKK